MDAYASDRIDVLSLTLRRKPVPESTHLNDDDPRAKRRTYRHGADADATPERCVRRPGARLLFFQSDPHTHMKHRSSRRRPSTTSSTR